MQHAVNHFTSFEILTNTITVTELAHMPARAQKVLSEPINAEISKEVRAVITGDSSMGAAERRERAEAQTKKAVLCYPWKQTPEEPTPNLPTKPFSIRTISSGWACVWLIHPT